MSITTWGWGAGGIVVGGWAATGETPTAPEIPVPDISGFGCVHISILEIIVNGLQRRSLDLASKAEFSLHIQHYIDRSTDLHERITVLEYGMANIVNSDQELKRKVEEADIPLRIPSNKER